MGGIGLFPACGDCNDTTPSLSRGATQCGIPATAMAAKAWIASHQCSQRRETSSSRGAARRGDPVIQVAAGLLHAYGVRND